MSIIISMSEMPILITKNKKQILNDSYIIIRTDKPINFYIEKWINKLPLLIEYLERDITNVINCLRNYCTITEMSNKLNIPENKLYLIMSFMDTFSYLRVIEV